MSLMLPAIGNALQAVLTLVFAYYRLPFWFIIVPGAVAGVFGGSGTMFCGLFAYVADVCGVRERTLQFAWLAAVQYFGITLGNLAITPLVHFGGGIEVCFWPVAIVYVLLALYIACIPESLPQHKRVEKLSWYKVNSISLVVVIIIIIG
jgi:MFS family permease